MSAEAKQAADRIGALMGRDMRAKVIQQAIDAATAKLREESLDLRGKLTNAVEKWTACIDDLHKESEENERLRNTIDDLLDGRQNPNYPKALSSREGGAQQQETKRKDQ